MKNQQGPVFMFGTKNFAVLIAGFLIVVVGFIMMSGGKSESEEIFNPEVFSTTRITYANWMVLIGFLVVGASIMLKPNSETADSSTIDS